jgi:6-phosphogluconolactonase
LNNPVKTFATPFELAESFALELIDEINTAEKRQKPISVALSGGSTPDLLFSLLGENFSKSANWKFVHFFWGDERCVPPSNQDSNYRSAYIKLLAKIDIPENNVHRIRGEEDPVNEAIRYSQEISSSTRIREGLPVFDLIMLGLGEDGHTASIFPQNIELINSDKICEVAVKPVTLQKRITITGRIINNSDSVVFLVTGNSKSEVVGRILNKNQMALHYPAYHIMPHHGKLRWLIDVEAGRLL